MDSPMPMTLLTDTREQRPWTFLACEKRVPKLHRKVVTLPTGDYSVEVYGSDAVADQIAIERKSLADFFASVGGGRQRFEAEMKRTAPYGYAGLVIEATLEQIANPNEHLEHPTRVNPRSAICSLLAWSARFGIHVWPCPGREAAQQVAYRLLERWHKDKNDGIPQRKTAPRSRRTAVGTIPGFDAATPAALAG